MITRRHIYFSGRVQGVGFRWTAVHAARERGLTGWVQNLWDGRVEMEVQGEAGVIRLFLADLEDDRYIHIQDMDWETLPPVAGESGFRTRG